MATEVVKEEDGTVIAANGPADAPVMEERQETLPESLAGTAFVFVLGLFFMMFLAQNYVIPSASMEKTLLIGDHVVVDRSTLAPQNYPVPFMHYRNIQHGDIIVFVKPNPEEPDLVLVKRAIGLPGDRIHLQDGILYRNGERQNEPQISLPSADASGNDGIEAYRDNFPTGSPAYNTTALWDVDRPNFVQNGEIVVPPGKIFAMGDNRTGSLDSRFWGFVPRENIMGRPMFVYWSFITPADEINKTGLANSVAWFTHELTHIISDTRWARTGHVVR